MHDRWPKALSQILMLHDSLRSQFKNTHIGEDTKQTKLFLLLILTKLSHDIVMNFDSSCLLWGGVACGCEGLTNNTKTSVDRHIL